MVFSPTGLGGSRSKLYVPSSENLSVPEAQNLSKGIYDDDGGGALDDTRICVCLRLRPMNKLEASRRSKNCVEVHRSGTGLTIDSPLDGEFNFSFDRVSFTTFATGLGYPLNGFQYLFYANIETSCY
jgi:hypothetical protein